MGNDSAMNAIGRWVQVCRGKVIERFKPVIGARIVNIYVVAEGTNEIKLMLKLDNGQYIDGPIVATYEEVGSDIVDGICSDYLEPMTVEKLYVRAGYKEYI